MRPKPSGSESTPTLSPSLNEEKEKNLKLLKRRRRKKRRLIPTPLPSASHLAKRRIKTYQNQTKRENNRKNRTKNVGVKQSAILLFRPRVSTTFPFPIFLPPSLMNHAPKRTQKTQDLEPTTGGGKKKREFQRFSRI